MKHTTGNLLNKALAGEFDVIVHGANCFCVMGAGIAAQIAFVFPEAYEADKATVSGDWSKLGTTSEVIVRDLVVVNGYTQYTPGRSVDYDAISRVFREVAKRHTGKRIGIPKIGAGIAGGDWEVIERIIDIECFGEDVTLVVYDI